MNIRVTRWMLAMFTTMLISTTGGMGCSDDDGGGGDVDAAVDAAAVDGEAVDAGGTDSVDLLVVEMVGDATQPLEGAMVALDDRYGGRMELTTGVDGTVSFTDFHWGDGEISLSVYKEGFVLWSGVGYTQADYAEIIQEMGGGRLWVQLEPVDPPTGIFLYGTAQNMVSVQNTLIVTTTTDTATFHEAAGADWALEVEPGEAQTLVSVEYEWGGMQPSMRGLLMTTFDWIVKDVAAATGDTEVVLDFAADAVDATDVHSATGMFAVPGRADSPLRTEGIVQLRVTDADSAFSAGLGFGIDTDISTDSNWYEYVAEWVQPAGIADPYTQYIVRDRMWGWHAIALQAGWPTQGQQNIEFLDLPRLITPATPGTPHPIAEPMEWELFDSDVIVMLIIELADEPLWYVGTWKDTTTVTLPDPPSNCDPATYLGLAPLTAGLFIGRSPAGEDFFNQFTYRQFRIQP